LIFNSIIKRSSKTLRNPNLGYDNTSIITLCGSGGSENSERDVRCTCAPCHDFLSFCSTQRFAPSLMVLLALTAHFYLTLEAIDFLRPARLLSASQSDHCGSQAYHSRFSHHACLVSYYTSKVHPQCIFTICQHYLWCLWCAASSLVSAQLIPYPDLSTPSVTSFK
jgi:hypothetical protein